MNSPLDASFHRGTTLCTFHSLGGGETITQCAIGWIVDVAHKRLMWLCLRRRIYIYLCGGQDRMLNEVPFRSIYSKRYQSVGSRANAQRQKPKARWHLDDITAIAPVAVLLIFDGYTLVWMGDGKMQHHQHCDIGGGGGESMTLLRQICDGGVGGGWKTL